jgi:hypothetical protein
MNLRKIGWSGIYWFRLAQNTNQWSALVNELSGLMKSWKILE